MQDKKEKVAGDLRAPECGCESGEKKCPKKQALVDELTELNDKYLRTAAELENVRRRSAVDSEAFAARRAMAVADEFLPLIDAILSAFAAAPEDEGVITMKKAADSTLARVGIVKIETVGEQLNPQFHNAIAAEDSDKPANTIISEMQAGYMFGDNVLRTAMVVVSK